MYATMRTIFIVLYYLYMYGPKIIRILRIARKMKELSKPWPKWAEDAFEEGSVTRALPNKPEGNESDK